MTYELHIDLLRCEHCSQHNKLLDFCSACGRTRTKIIVVPLYEHKKDVQAPYKCPVCYSQRHLSQKCVYCDLKMPVNRNCDGWLERIPRTTAAKRAAKPRWGNAKKKAAKKIPKPDSTPSMRVRVYDRDGQCLRCGKTDGFTLHHIIHVSAGGKNTMENLQTLCGKCHTHVHDVLKIPSGTPYAHSLELDPLTQEEEDAQWNRIRRKRAAEKGKNASSYTYGKSLATNFAAPEIARLRRK